MLHIVPIELRSGRIRRQEANLRTGFRDESQGLRTLVRQQVVLLHPVTRLEHRALDVGASPSTSENEFLPQQFPNRSLVRGQDKRFATRAMMLGTMSPMRRRCCRSYFTVPTETRNRRSTGSRVPSWLSYASRMRLCRSNESVLTGWGCKPDSRRGIGQPTRARRVGLRELIPPEIRPVSDYDKSGTTWPGPKWDVAHAEGGNLIEIQPE